MTEGNPSINPCGVRALVIASVLAGCGAGTLDGIGPNGDGADAGGTPCHLNLVFDPEAPVAGPATTVRVSAVTLDVPGVLTYSWSVTLNGTSVGVTFAQDDHSQIDFQAPTPGIYVVSLNVSGSPLECSSSVGSIDVRAPGAPSQRFRLRVVPPPSVVAPPLEKLVTAFGSTGALLGTVSLDRGISVRPQVSSLGGGVPAYLRFAPASMPGAVVEGYADAAGRVTAQLLPQPHTVLIVPSDAVPPDPGSAPRRIASWSPSNTTFLVDAGSPITGTVRDPADAPLPRAKVQLLIDGVPSTLAETAGDGSFALRAVTVASAAVTVEVTPPNASGLPRLSATSQGFDLGVPLQIRYAASLARKDLAGTRVERQGAPVANASVVVVGSLAAVGTVTAGASASATGDVRISASAGAGGTLPSTLVPSASLSAVVTVTAGDLAVVALDTTATVPAILDAPAMRSIAPVVLGVTGAGLRGAVLDLVPTGALAMAAAPALHVTSDPSGRITAALADGGHYDLRFHDPLGRAALLVVTDRVATTIAASYRLPAAVQVRGSLKLDGLTPLANASVQILCEACTGLEREKPIAETASDANGQFTLAVPDPGTL